jgi:hypothetical protein
MISTPPPCSLSIILGLPYYQRLSSSFGNHVPLYALFYLIALGAGQNFGRCVRFEQAPGSRENQDSGCVLKDWLKKRLMRGRICWPLAPPRQSESSVSSILSASVCDTAWFIPISRVLNSSSQFWASEQISSPVSRLGLNSASLRAKSLTGWWTICRAWQSVIKRNTDAFPVRQNVLHKSNGDLTPFPVFPGFL